MAVAKARNQPHHAKDRLLARCATQLLVKSARLRLEPRAPDLAKGIGVHCHELRAKKDEVGLPWRRNTRLSDARSVNAKSEGNAQKGRKQQP